MLYLGRFVCRFSNPLKVPCCWADGSVGPSDSAASRQTLCGPLGGLVCLRLSEFCRTAPPPQRVTYPEVLIQLAGKLEFFGSQKAKKKQWSPRHFFKSWPHSVRWSLDQQSALGRRRSFCCNIQSPIYLSYLFIFLFGLLDWFVGGWRFCFVVWCRWMKVRAFLKDVLLCTSWVLPVMLTWSEGNSQLMCRVVLVWNKCLTTFFFLFSLRNAL